MKIFLAIVIIYLIITIIAELFFLRSSKEKLPLAILVALWPFVLLFGIYLLLKCGYEYDQFPEEKGKV